MIAAVTTTAATAKTGRLAIAKATVHIQNTTSALNAMAMAPPAKTGRRGRARLSISSHKTAETPSDTRINIGAADTPNGQSLQT